MSEIFIYVAYSLYIVFDLMKEVMKMTSRKGKYLTLAEKIQILKTHDDDEFELSSAEYSLKLQKLYARKRMY